MNSKSTSRKIVVERTAEADMEFRGNLVASVSSQACNGTPSIRWTELSLYAVESGGYVAHSVGRSRAEKEVDWHYAAYYRKLNQVPEFYKHDGRFTWLSKELFTKVSKVLPEFTATEKVG